MSTEFTKKKKLEEPEENDDELFFTFEEEKEPTETREKDEDLSFFFPDDDDSENGASALFCSEDLPQSPPMNENVTTFTLYVPDHIVPFEKKKIQEPEVLSAVEIACVNGDLNYLENLRQQGCISDDINLFRRACEAGRIEILEFLLTWVKFKDYDHIELMIVESIIKNGNPRMIKYLLNKKEHIGVDIPFIFLTALSCRSLKSIRTLIKNRVDVDCKIECRITPKSFKRTLKTPLMFAIDDNWFAAFKFFLESGAHPNNQSGTGETALMLATRKNDFEMVKMLFEYGANPNMKDNEGWGAFHEVKSVEMAVFLLENGGKPKTHNNNHYTPFILLRNLEM